MLVSLALQIHTSPVLDPFKHTSIKTTLYLDCSVKPVYSRKAGKLMDFMKGTSLKMFQLKYTGLKDGKTVR